MSRERPLHSEARLRIMVCLLRFSSLPGGKPLTAADLRQDPSSLVETRLGGALIELRHLGLVHEEDGVISPTAAGARALGREVLRRATEPGGRIGPAARRRIEYALSLQLTATLLEDTERGTIEGSDCHSTESNQHNTYRLDADGGAT